MSLPTPCAINVKKDKRKEVIHEGQYQRQKFCRSRLSLACIKTKPKEEVGMPPISHPAVVVIMFVLFSWYNTDIPSTSQCPWFSRSAFAHSEGHVLLSVWVFFFLSLSLSHYKSCLLTLLVKTGLCFFFSRMCRFSTSS